MTERFDKILFLEDQMMRLFKPQRIVFLVMILNLFLFSGGEVSSAIAPKGTWRRKLERGFLNTAFSPLEISNALAEEKVKGDNFPSWVIGLARGSYLAVLRAATGIYDVVTAPLPLPPRYEPTLLPEFSLDYLPSSKGESNRLLGATPHPK